MSKSLSDLMDFDHVIRVHEDGTVTDGPAGIYAPSLFDEELDSEGWEFFSAGYTGQYGYNGPIMHDSELIGGRLERDILATPGLYVAVVAYWSPDPYDLSEDECECCQESIIEGWAIARHEKV